MQLESPSPVVRVAKAGRAQVLAAADEILRTGQRPTIEAVQAHLGGGSPNSIVAYLKDWYGGLGERLAALQEPADGLSPEVHQAALSLQRVLLRAATSNLATDGTEALIRSLRAESKSQQLLLDELRAQKGRDLQSLAESRALLLRKDEELQGLNAAQTVALSRIAVLEQRLKSRVRPPPATPLLKMKKRSTSRAKLASRAKAKSKRKPSRRRRIARR